MSAFADTRGFSLIEIMIVMALITVVAGFSTTMSFHSIIRSSSSAERNLFVSLLVGARGQALANINQKAHGVYRDTNNYVLFEGMAYTDTDPTNQKVPRNASVTISGPQTYVFSQLMGDTLSGTGTTTIGDITDAQTVYINAVGRINW